MDIFQAAILGVVQGISEFLPISSTGHLILTSRILGLPGTDFLKSFEIAIQLGSILAVVVLFWRKLFFSVETIKRLIFAFLPTGILGLIFYKIVKNYLLGSEKIVLGALFVGGALLIIFELWHQKKETATPATSDISYKKAFFIGLFQALAMIPGVSRSAATILGGLFLGLERRTIVEFSFLLAVPTMLAATGYDLLKNAAQFSGSDWQALAIGFLMSFIVALLAIKWLLSFIRQHTFISFGIYRIIISAIFFSYFFL